MLEVKNVNYQLHTEWGKRTDFSIRNVNFSLEDGYLMCLLGKNGAGKSTLLKLLYGLHEPDAGSISWKDMDSVRCKERFRQEVAYVGEEDMFFPEEMIGESVRILSGLYTRFSMNVFMDHICGFDLDKKVLEQKMDELSTGERMQVQLAFALARKPQLLLLDEPMANLDPVFRVKFMEILQQLIAGEGVTVILSTHVPEEVEDVADYIGILRKGEMVCCGDRESVLQHHDTLREVLQNTGNKLEGKE
ncbi:MAG: ABC transporter ATP-binding protein [Lachnospiraceae bacterium]|nr:ABC transporter ATP-binding protein [Lachnospiraceae bacterium]